MDKPAGITSHDVVQRVRRALRVRAAGHTGTLDPFATGLLVVLLGRATRLARFVEAQAKTYHAVARLGIRTDTDDRTGTVLEECPSSIWAWPTCVERWRRFSVRGDSGRRPTPPSTSMASAATGWPAAARRWCRRRSPVTVHAVEWVRWTPPDLEFRITASAGTYIRAVARDLGAALGVGGHLRALRREAIGGLRVEDAVAVDAVVAEAVRSPASVLGHLPAVTLDAGGEATRSTGAPCRRRR